MQREKRLPCVSRFALGRQHGAPGMLLHAVLQFLLVNNQNITVFSGMLTPIPVLVGMAVSTEWPLGARPDFCTQGFSQQAVCSQAAGALSWEQQRGHLSRPLAPSRGEGEGDVWCPAQGQAHGTASGCSCRKVAHGPAPRATKMWLPTGTRVVLRGGKRQHRNGCRLRGPLHYK